MAVTGIKKCPHCGSTKVEQDTTSVVTHAAKGAVAYGVGFLGSFAKKAILNSFGPGNYGPGVTGKIANSILKDGSYDYTCKRCGKSFEIHYKDNVITKITKY